MPLPDLYMVTNAIRSLIATQASLAYNGTAGSVDVTVVSPQDESGTLTTPVVNVYLFHLIEDAHYKNQPARNGSGPVPIQHIPIGLDLHYVITVRVPDSDTRVASEHKLLGIVAKILHDFPIVTQDILTDPILGADDHFDLILRPVSLEETINFWASDETHVTRPSLFVEARVIQLEPEPPQILPGIVLTLGTFIFAGPGPRLVTSRSQLAFIPPGFGLQRVSAEPARVALHVQTQDPFPSTVTTEKEQDAIRQNNRLTLEGSGFGRGHHRFIELARIGDTTGAPVRIDLDPSPGVNDKWDLAISSEEIGLSFFTTVTDADGNAQSFVPGMYTARVVLDDDPRTSVSNQLVFAVVPQVLEVTSGTPDVHSLVLTGTYLNASVDVVLVVGDQIMKQVTALANPGDFTVVDPSTVAFQIAPPAPTDFPIPVNLTVNGAQATPAWVEAP
jgi:hypothetical protein